MSDLVIREATPADEARWRVLWDGYCRFYETEPSDAVTAHTWARIMDPAGPVFAIVATDAAGRIVGFANCVIHENTWSLTPVCYLEDLFVDPDARAQGVGRALIDRLLADAKAKGWSRLYWHTKEDNARARALYDSYAPHSGFLMYVVKTPA